MRDAKSGTVFHPSQHFCALVTRHQRRPSKSLAFNANRYQWPEFDIWTEAETYGTLCKISAFELCQSWSGLGDLDTFKWLSREIPIGNACRLGAAQDSAQHVLPDGPKHHSTNVVAQYASLRCACVVLQARQRPGVAT